MDFRCQSARLGRALVIVAGVAAAIAPAGCGKKGPPLAPLVSLPEGVSDLQARRLGDAIVVQFTVPAKNSDATAPADLRHVEVYAYTALEASEGSNLKRLRLLATIPVKAPPKPVEATEEGEPPGTEAVPAEAGVEQGDLIAVAEAVTDDLRVPLPPDPKAPKPKVLPAPTPLFAAPFPESQIARFYVAVGVNRKGKRGALSPRSAVPLGDAPPAPPAPSVAVTEAAVVLSWERPPALRKPYHDKDAGAVFDAWLFGWLVTLPAPKPTIPSTRKGLPPQPTIRYNVYRVSGSGPPDAPLAPVVPGLVEMPVPLGATPVAALTFSDPIVEWNVQQCYAVRTVETEGTAIVESELSPVTCVTPEDTFPPAAPASLAAVASQGAISLIWDRVDAPDLAGYIVLRGTAPDGPLAPLFETPIRETTYRDGTALPGVRHVYEVIAVDNAIRPNWSVPSNRVVEGAR